MRSVLTALLLAALASAAPVLAQPPAVKQQRAATRPDAAAAVSAQVLIVHAAHSARGIDPRLREVPALRRPPFDSYQSMALLSSPRIQLRIGQPENVSLPNGRHIRIVLREVTAEGRYRLQVSINRPGEQDYLPELNVVASPGDPFFVAGQSYQDGMLVIGIRLGAR